ncbi:MAG: hypothetical protein M3024_08455 [Candidatus Dormibacteraeota bacterium]|nr:hypothetical protein [Candidatus Dormibacteraeota bacterium]
MRAQLLGAGVGAMAILVGLGWIFGAIRRQRGHATSPDTYRALGGPLYAVFQIGCSGLLVVGGLIVISLVLLGGSRR